jgi:hypothetical protein
LTTARWLLDERSRNLSTSNTQRFSFHVFEIFSSFSFLSDGSVLMGQSLECVGCALLRCSSLFSSFYRSCACPSCCPCRRRRCRGAVFHVMLTFHIAEWHSDKLYKNDLHNDDWNMLWI